MTLRESVRRRGLLRPGDRVLCALSGGADSVCMTHQLWTLRGELQIELAAAHFSHGLRPERAEAERRFCADFCAGLGIPLFCGAGDTAAYARAHRLGTEEAARTLRYAFLEETGRAWGADRIATAHNRGDQCETVLFRLIRGGGARGLAGIPAQRGPYIRPLLDTGRAEIEAYLAARGLPYVTDSSNFDRRYARNRLRLEVLPLLERIHPGAADHIASAAELLAADDDCLSAQALALTDGCRASAAALAGSHPAVAGRAVQALWRAAGGKADLYRRQVESVLALCAAAAPGAGVDLPGGIRARREYDLLILEPRAAGAPSVPEEQPLAPNVPVRFGGWEVLWRDPAPEGAPSLPRAALSPPLTVRARRAGDRILLPGGGKTLKKWMIEQKIPKEKRDTVPVVCDTEGVAAVPGAQRAAAAQPAGERVSIIFRRTEK